MFRAEKTALLSIDLQRGFAHPTYFGSSRSNPALAENTTKIISAFRSMACTQVVHIHQNSLLADSPLHLSRPGVLPESYAEPSAGKPIFMKAVSSTFVGTALEAWSRKRDIGRLVVVGITTDHRVSTSVRTTANLGVVHPPGLKGEVLLVGDATCTHAKKGFDVELV